jgi:hypothetical protein
MATLTSHEEFIARCWQKEKPRMDEIDLLSWIFFFHRFLEEYERWEKPKETLPRLNELQKLPDQWRYLCYELVEPKKKHLFMDTLAKRRKRN